MNNRKEGWQTKGSRFFELVLFVDICLGAWVIGVEESSKHVEEMVDYWKWSVQMVEAWRNGSCKYLD